MDNALILIEIVKNDKNKTDICNFLVNVGDIMDGVLSFWKMLNRDIYVGRRLKNNLLALTIVSLFTAILGFILVIIDFISKNYSMLIPAFVTFACGVACALISGVFKKRKIAIWIPLIFCMFAFVYYALSGISNGTAIYWSFLMPIGICYFVSVRAGFLISIFYSIFYSLLFYTPLNKYVVNYYTEEMMVRFPMLFVAMAGFTLIAMIQYHRVALVEIDYSKKLKNEVEIQTKYAMDRASKLEHVTEEIVRTLASVIDAKDKYTNGHSFRVAMYSCELAKKIGFDDVRINELRWEALLHDIGKIGIPDMVLNKPGKLTKEEFTLIQSHTIIGGEILSQSSELKQASDTTRHHHERYDGKGYPDGLKGNEIPLNARIIAIADSYDAMNSTRTYRKGLPKELIRQQLVWNRGAQFDPKLLDKFLELFDNGVLDNALSTAKLDNK